MKGNRRSARRHRAAVGLVALLTVALMVSLVGCERPKKSKSSGMTTAVPTADASVVVSASPTVVSTAEETPTSAVETPSPTSVPQEPSPTLPATDTPLPGTVNYTVQRGDTLYSIAQRYNVTVDELKAANGITDAGALEVGQILIIPTGQQPSLTPTPTGGQTTHVVQRGENLFRIALRYGTTVQAIASRNNIVNPSLIWAGQKLIIPVGQDGSPPSPGTVHTVQPGENLYRIALRYGTTPWAIAVANGLNNIHYIYVGQRLRIP